MTVADAKPGIAAADAVDAMRRRIADARAQATPGSAKRIAIRMEPVDPYAWLARQTAAQRLLWSGREDPWTLAGIGAADVVRGGAATAAESLLLPCRAMCRRLPGARYFGGFAFDRAGPADGPWLDFGTALFVLPRFEILQTSEATWFVCNLPEPLDAPAGLERELDALQFTGLDPVSLLPPIAARRDSPDRDGWRRNVETALALIAHEVLEKIVLARQACFEFSAPVDAARIIAKLRHVTSRCYRFCFQPSARAAFMGTTPERLFRRTGRLLQSEVIAGTRPRSRDREADDALARDLLSSEKDQREHDIVRKSIRQSLHLLCESLEVEEEARLLQLERKQHLYSGITGRLAPQVTDGLLIDALHPTPAVGGYPTALALAEIARIEPFRRGWYAAPVGWVDAADAEFAVAIRSGLVEGPRVHVYSGAGIVRGSRAEDEWSEIENKIVDFIKITSPA